MSWTRKALDMLEWVFTSDYINKDLLESIKNYVYERVLEELGGCTLHWRGAACLAAKALNEDLASALNLSPETLAAVYPYAVWLEMELDAPALPGHGSQLLPLDWGLLVHPIYRIPYFPGSTIKGAMRATYMDLAQAKGRLDKHEAERCAGEIFGTAQPGMAHIGLITVLDAYPQPSEDPIIEPDILTPHYYKGGKPVTSELEAIPTPVRGVRVRRGTKYTFTALIREPKTPSSPCTLNQDLPSLTLKILYTTLTSKGLGGRTLKGYGIFKLVKKR